MAVAERETKFLHVILDRDSLEEVWKDEIYRFTDDKHDVFADVRINFQAKNPGSDLYVFYSSDDLELIGRQIVQNSRNHSVPLPIRSRDEVNFECEKRGEVTEVRTKDFKMDRFKLPEFHVHFDVWGWRDATGEFREGIPRILVQELEGIVHVDSFNPFYTVLTRDGEMPAKEAFRETPYLFTSGLTCENLEVTPEEARRARIGFDVLNQKLLEIEEKHGIELVGYTELELISMVVKLSDKEFDPRMFEQYFTPTEDGDRSVVKLETGNIESGFKCCEFHFKLGKGYEPRLLKGLIDLGLINAAMPPGEDGKITPYFTMQGRSVEVRDQLASFIGLLARTVGGFGEGAQIQLETIVGHKFFGKEFASDKHLPKIVTGIGVEKDAPTAGAISQILNRPQLQGVLVGQGRRISEITESTNINASYREARRSLKANPASETEIANVVAELSAWNDNPDEPAKPKVLERR